MLNKPVEHARLSYDIAEQQYKASQVELAKTAKTGKILLAVAYVIIVVSTIQDILSD